MENEITRKIFETVYKWGRVGIVTDEHSPAFRSLIDEFVTFVKEDKKKVYAKGSKCPKCGTPSEVICKCEVANFRVI